MIDTINAIISTLETVEVKGKTNLSRLLGCINALESMVGQLRQAEDKSKKEEAVDNGGPGDQ